MADLASIGEFGLIDLIGDGIFAAEKIIKGIGDDCAVLPFDETHYQLISCDMLNDGIHFLYDKISPYQLGYKAVAASLSDIAAMGGTPSNLLLSIGLTQEGTIGWWQEFYRGVSDICRRYRVNIAGGDTTKSNGGLCINVTVLGLVKKTELRLRSHACVGDRLFVTGPLGGSRAGLELLLRPEIHVADEAVLLQQHLQPEPCCQEIRWLNQAAGDALHGLNDISDGLASECWEIAAASGVGIVIEAEAVPFLSETAALAKVCGNKVIDWALFGGEDYQLVGTIAAAQAEAIALQYQRQSGKPLHWIGQVIAGNGVFLQQNADKTPIKAKGYAHF